MEPQLEGATSLDTVMVDGPRIFTYAPAREFLQLNPQHKNHELDQLVYSLSEICGTRHQHRGAMLRSAAENGPATDGNKIAANLHSESG